MTQATQGQLGRAIRFVVVVGIPIAAVVLAYAMAEARAEFTDGGDITNASEIGRTLWLALVAASTLTIVVAGWAVNGEYFGAFIDARNRYSLSRLQLAAWTIVVLSAWLAAVIVRIVSNMSIDVALEVAIPAAVVTALGLSTGAFALSAAIDQNKSHKTVDLNARRGLEADYNAVVEELNLLVKRRTDAQKDRDSLPTDDERREPLVLLVENLERTEAALGTREAALKAKLSELRAAEGLLSRNERASDAAAGDLFRGDEVGTTETLDFGKVQMLFFSVSVIGSYALVLLSALNNGDLYSTAAGGVALPEMSDSLVTLLGISHGGYLGTKAIGAGKDG